MVVTSKIATGNQIDFETLSPSIDVTCLSLVPLFSLTVSPTLSFALQIRVFAQRAAHGRCRAAMLLQLNYTPRPSLALDSGSSKVTVLLSRFPLPSSPSI